MKSVQRYDQIHRSALRKFNEKGGDVVAKLKLKGNRIQITITLKPEVAKELDRIAEKDGRSRSNMANRLIEKALEKE